MEMSEKAIPQNRSPIPLEVYNPFFDKIGNHEIKLAASGLLLSLRESFTWASFMSLFEERLEGRLEVHARSVLNLCKRNLTGESGIVVAAPEGLLTTSKRRLERLALTGFLSEWSVRWSDLSVRQLYPPGRLKSDKPFSPVRQAPSIRHAIFTSVYQHEMAEDPVSIPELRQEIKVSTNTIVRHVRRLVDDRILHKGSERGSEYAVRITADCNFPLTPPGNSSPEARAFYAAVNHLGVGLTSVQQLVKAAKALHPKIDAPKLASLIRGHLLRGGGPKGVEFIADRKRGMQKQTSIRFADGVRKPMHDLVKGTMALQKGERLEWYAQRCDQAMRNRSVFRFLVAKGLVYPQRKSAGSLEQ